MKRGKNGRLGTMRKNVKETKKLLAEIDLQIKAFELAQKGIKPEDWTLAENGILTLLRCFKFVFEHNV